MRVRSRAGWLCCLPPRAMRTRSYMFRGTGRERTRGHRGHSQASHRSAGSRIQLRRSPLLRERTPSTDCAPGTRVGPWGPMTLVSRRQLSRRFPLRQHMEHRALVSLRCIERGRGGRHRCGRAVPRLPPARPARREPTTGRACAVTGNGTSSPWCAGSAPASRQGSSSL